MESRVSVYGDAYESLLNKVCISTGEIEKRTHELLGFGKAKKTVEWREDDLGYMATDEEEEPFEKREKYHLDPNNAYQDVMNNMERSGLFEHDEEDAKRSQKLFEPERRPLNDYSFEDLVVEEILKYGFVGYETHLQKWRSYLKEMVEIYTFWKEIRLGNSLCSLAFDVDFDGQLTHKEYVISIYSKVVHDLVVPKVFLSLIGPLVEHSCISLEDLRKLDHSPKTIKQDFIDMDINGDGCFSLEEFEMSMKDVCQVNWFKDFLKESGLELYTLLLEPTPEEVYVRLLKENERMNTNWIYVDIDRDGFISNEELRNDLLAFGTFDAQKEANGLMKHFDKDKDGKASIDEVKYQISVPSFTEDYQYDWLESLYEIYETDQAEVKEELNTLFHYHNLLQTNNGVVDVKRDRLFEIFDKNGNGEMDKVELKLLLQMLKKYVVYYMLDMTVSSLDLDFDGKLGIQEYEQFFANVSSNLSLYFTYLMTAQEDEIVQEIARHIIDEEDDDEIYEEGTDENGESVVYYKLLKKAGGANETYFVHKLFRSLDTNSDGFLSKEDFYYKMRSKRIRKTDAQLQEQFSELDIDKDGVLTEKDGVEITEPLTFKMFKNAIDIFEEEIEEDDLAQHMSTMDSNGDSVIQSWEFEVTKRTLVNSEDEEGLLTWFEEYFGGTAISQMDAQGVHVFSEFDTNCDGFISKTEFQQKIEQLRQKTEPNVSSIKLSWEADVYFNNLDLSKDGKVSYNEFDFLLLRAGGRINE